MIHRPAFEENNIVDFFGIAECQFSAAQIVQLPQKVPLILGALPSDVVYNLPTNLITQHDYDAIKDILIKRYSRSLPQAFNEMFKKNPVPFHNPAPRSMQTA